MLKIVFTKNKCQHHESHHQGEKKKRRKQQGNAWPFEGNEFSVVFLTVILHRNNTSCQVQVVPKAHLLQHIPLKKKGSACYNVGTPPANYSTKEKKIVKQDLMQHPPTSQQVRLPLLVLVWGLIEMQNKQRQINLMALPLSKRKKYRGRLHNSFSHNSTRSQIITDY